MTKLRDLVGVLRTKNAGAFELTIDIMFTDKDVYEKVKATGVVSRELFSRLYKVPVEDVFVAEYDAALAIKGTIPRRVPSGSPGDNDVYGAQQHAPLLDVEVPLA